MTEKEYIEKRKLIEAWERECTDATDLRDAFDFALEDVPAADVVEVCRCKNCKWFVPKHILMDDGSTREYTEEEKKLPLGVPGNVGINCGSRCMRHISWLENSVPVWVQENDYCSYGERKEATP